MLSLVNHAGICTSPNHRPWRILTIERTNYGTRQIDGRVASEIALRGSHGSGLRDYRIRLFAPRFRCVMVEERCAAAGADNAPATGSSSPTESAPVASGGLTTCATRRRLGGESCAVP